MNHSKTNTKVNSQKNITTNKNPLTQAIYNELYNETVFVKKRAGILPTLILASSLVTLTSTNVDAAVFNVMNTGDSGAGSLRQAILDSNASAGPDAIVFDNAVTGTITLTSGQLPIYDDLAIVGPGSANLSIDANASSRIFRIDDSTSDSINVEISGLTLTGGSALGGAAVSNYNENITIRDSVLSYNDGTFGGSGAIESDGGIVQIIDSQITNNTSSEAGGAIGVFSGSLIIRGSTLSGNSTTSGNGGAIYAYNLDTLVVDDSTLSNNYAATGGAIFTGSSKGSVLISNSTINNNTAGEGQGGGLYNSGFKYYSGSLTIDNTMIIGNSTSGDGGGIGSSAGSVFIKNSSVISNNISGDDGGGIFFNDVTRGQILDISDSTINNNTSEGYGGGVHFYAENPDLRIRNTTISGNVADAGGGGIAIYYGSSNLYGAITIQNTTISNNTASSEGGGLMLEVDDAHNAILIEDSLITGNSAGSDGGGLHFYFDDGLYTSLIIRDTVISNNTADEGGGMSFYDDDGYDIVIANSTISGNFASENGGGISMYSDDGALIMTNSTVSGNTAGSRGGGLYLTHEDGGARIENSTIVDNSAYYGGGLFNNSSKVAIRGSIIANNNATNEYADIGGTDLYVQFSLIESPEAISLAQNFNNVFYVDPMLGSLANNGGPTMTHALLVGSPAIDTGLNAAPSADDQRGIGFDRMVGLQTDMGALESTTDTPLSFPAATQTVTNLDDNGLGSLRQAIINSNNTPGLDVIEFDPALNGSIALASGSLSITDDLVINAPVPSVITIEGSGVIPSQANKGKGYNYNNGNGLFNINRYSGQGRDKALGDPIYNLMSVDINGLTISNNNSGSGIYVSNTELTVRNSTISNNTADYQGGGIDIYGGVARILDSVISSNYAFNNSGVGGGISLRGYGSNVLGSLVVRNTDVINNNAYSGGGIQVDDGASVAIDNSTISNNNSFDDDGGGVNINGLNGSVSISDSMITGNSAYDNGGGLAVNRLDGYNFHVTLDNTTVDNNDVYNGDGGGIYFDARGHQLNILNNSIITNNNVNNGGDGGGVHFDARGDGSQLRIVNSTISNNTADGDGGGISFNTADAQLDIINSTISMNSADGEGGGLHVYSTYRYAPINIIGSTFDGNSAVYDGGGILIVGDDFFASILIENTTITNNYAGDDGGGLSTYANDGFYMARFTIRDSVIDGNEADDNGGGIYFFDQGGDADFIIENSTISNNTAGGEGGGLWFYSDDGGFVLNNTTISNNTATSDGGGFHLEYSADPRTINNSTITGNSADVGGGMYISSPTNLFSSIIFGNTATFSGQDIGGNEDLYIQHSLLGDATDIGSTTINDLDGNIFNQDPLLGPLTNNGGSTQTHTLMAGSPAINRGLNFAALASDQNDTGFARTQGTRTDMGAVEVVGNPVLSGLLTGGPIPENAGVGTITAALTESAGVPTVIDLTFSSTALLDTDFGIDTNFLFLPTGDLVSQDPVTITAIDDVIFEGDEPFTATGTSISGPSPFSTQNGIILEDESIPTFSLSLVGDPIAENAGVATVTASLSGLSAFDITGNFVFSGTATNAIDYTSVNSLTIPAGMMMGDFTIIAVDDALDEIDETVILDVDTVTNGVENGAQQVMTTIIDDDAAPLTTVSLSIVSVNEGSTVDIILTLNAPSGQDITITLGFTGTASDPADYTVSSNTVIILAGQTTGMVTIAAVADLMPEPDETIIIDILSVINGTEDGVQQTIVSVIDGSFAPIMIPSMSVWSKWLLILTMPFAAVLGMRRRKKQQ